MLKSNLHLKLAYVLILSTAALVLTYFALLPTQCMAQASSLYQMIRQYEDMKEDVQMEIKKSSATILQAQKIVELAHKKGNANTEYVARQALEKALNAKRKNERTLSQIQRDLDRLYKLRGKEREIERARERIAELNEDVKAIQFALAIYRDALITNATTLEQEEKKVSQMSDKILLDGIDYLKGAAFSLLKVNFKYWEKTRYENYEKILGHVETLQTEDAILGWINSKSDDVEKLVEGADLLASTAVPGWDHVKANFKAWSTVARECIAWKKINHLNQSTDEYSRAVETLSNRMKVKMKQINCLKHCMDEYIVGCTTRCSK